MKRSFALFLALAMVLSFAACGADAESTEPAATQTSAAQEVEGTTQAPFDLDAYKVLVSDCVAEISDGAVVLSNVARKEHEYWETLNDIGGKFAAEDAVSTAMKWLEEKSDYSAETIDEQYDKIAAMYKEIIFTDVEGQEAEKITENFEELFDAYIGLYDLALVPSGDISSFAAKYNDYIDIITSCTSKLDILLE